MRNDDQQRIALECLKLAAADFPGHAVAMAEGYLAFVTGTEIDDARSTLERVKQAIA